MKNSSKYQTICYEDKTSLSIDQIKSIVPTFRTKADAIKHGKRYGWLSAVKLEGRFEHVYVVGMRRFPDDDRLGFPVQVFIFPAFQRESDGAMKVFDVRRIKNS